MSLKAFTQQVRFLVPIFRTSIIFFELLIGHERVRTNQEYHAAKKLPPSFPQC